MRHSDPDGRFTIAFEKQSIFAGADADMRAPIGHHVQWVEFDPEASEVDVIYDVANRTVGRVWKDPVRVPAYAAFIFQGVSMHNDRGFYNTDVLRMSAMADVMERIFPKFFWEPDIHIKDRILYRGKIFIPTQINLRGLLRNEHTVVTVEANEVNPEERVNDPVLLDWANRDIHPPQPYDPQLFRVHTSA